MKKTTLLLVTIVMIILNCTITTAHPGRTDSYGGHWNHSTGTYHYHSGEYAGQTQSSETEHQFYENNTLPSHPEDSKPKNNKEHKDTKKEESNNSQKENKSSIILDGIILIIGIIFFLLILSPIIYILLFILVSIFYKCKDLLNKQKSDRKNPK